MSTNPKTEDATELVTPVAAASGLPMAVGALAVQAWADMGTEAVRFVCDRLEQDFKTQQAMLACASMDDLRKIQTAFFAAAREQYAAETVRLLDLIGKAALSGLTTATTARRYDDVPL